MWIQAINNKKVKKAIADSGFSKKEICDATGAKAPALCKFLNFGWGLSEGKLALIADFLDCDLRDWLLVPEPSKLGLSEREVRIIQDFLLVNIEED